MVKLAQSDVKPTPVWVRPLDDGNAIVTLRRNVVEVEAADGEDGEKAKHYEYEETDVTVVNRPNLEVYAKSNLDAFFDMAEQRNIDETLPTQVDMLTEIVTMLMFEIDMLKTDKGAE